MKKRTLRKAQRIAKLAGIATAAIYAASGIVILQSEIKSNEVGLKVGIQCEVAEIEIVPEYNLRTEEPEGTNCSLDLDANEEYILAKIAMAEAEGEDTEGKALVMLTVLNRVLNDRFPGSIEEIILQKDPCIQFSVTADGGRYWSVEPDKDCWEALKLVESGWNESQNALYFESQGNSVWHKKNLDFLYEHGNHYFYTDKE